MKTNKDVYFPYYSGNIKFTKCQGHVSLDYFIESHKNPKQQIKDLILKISKMNSPDQKPLKRELKQKLFSFTPSVFINKGLKRKYENISCYTGLIQLDFDKIENKKTAKQLKEHLFENYPEIVCSYLSPSGLGVKCLMKITRPETKEQYKALHKAINNEFDNLEYFDPATKNPMLPLFLSYDKEILYRDYLECDTWQDEDNSVIEYVSLNDNKNSYKENINADYNNKKTCRIFVSKVRSIVDNGHTQLRSACLILGSRCGADYLDLNSAYSLAEQMIKENNYLSKDTKNYISTSAWAINQGFKNPKYYN